MNGRFGDFGGRYVPETLVPALERLEVGWREAAADAGFGARLATELNHWAGRPTPLTQARRLGEAWGVDVWLKREDLLHTGAHKINNAVGQALLAQRLGTRRVIAETGAGQHGVATASACARLGLPCEIFMGEIDARRQAPNVDRMKRLGATVVEVGNGDRTLRAAIGEALRAWVADPEDTYYLIGSVVGPHPYPWIVRELQSVIGTEARSQIVARVGELPDAVFACVGGGSNAIGLFRAFEGDPGVRLYGIEAGGTGNEDGRHAATVSAGRPGILHGSYTLLLQSPDGQIHDTHSISAGLDYPGVGPEHAQLAASGRVIYGVARDEEVLECLDELCRLEGILPALESSHALAGARRWARDNHGVRVLVGLSGRGDKDLGILRSVDAAISGGVVEVDRPEATV